MDLLEDGLQSSMCLVGCGNILFGFSFKHSGLWMNRIQLHGGKQAQRSLALAIATATVLAKNMYWRGSL